MALIMIGGIAALLASAGVIARLLVAALRFLPQRGYSWRYGLANLRRRPLGASMQIGALGLGLMALLLLTLVRGDLMQNWRATLPADAPTVFLINVLPDQAAGVRDFLKRELRVDAVSYPMVRGRLVAINEVPFDTTKLPDDRARRLGEREFNLSAVAELPASNTIVAGQWWKPGEVGGMSLEDGIAETLGIKLGDTLTWDFAGTRLSARVTSLRKVAWDSFRVNFFAVFPPGVLDAMPTTYIAAIRVPAGNAKWLTPLVREFPNVLVIDIGELLHQVQSIIEEVARAVEFVFLFTLLAGILVLEAAIAVTQDERRYDAAILRTLGASQRQLAAAQVTEFLAIGVLAGLLASAGATIIGYVLASRTFQIPFHWNPWVWAIGIVGGAIGVAIAGWFGTRSTLRQSPLAVLRQLA
jgi:putative ABC transport system permease protein